MLSPAAREPDEKPNIDISLPGFGDDEIAKLMKTRRRPREARPQRKRFDLDAAWQTAKTDTRVQRGATSGASAITA